MYDITASLVVYKNDIRLLRETMTSFLSADLNIKLYVVDNSPFNDAESICADKRIEYIFNNKNLGFAASHNIAVKKALNTAKYHLVLNPDISFGAEALEKLYDIMERDREIGLLMPKICNLDGSVQYLCKLLPAPLDLILRRSKSKILCGIFRKRLNSYALTFTGYDKIMDVPHLSGCFMFIRQEVLEKTGAFDERFFMYLEDVDLSRRIHKHYKTIYYPDVVVYHKHGGHSYVNTRALRYHIVSAVKYFNKWGWFFDDERKSVNRLTLERYAKKGSGR